MLRSFFALKRYDECGGTREMPLFLLPCSLLAFAAAGGVFLPVCRLNHFKKMGKNRKLISIDLTAIFFSIFLLY